ncbi:hypothetical protein FB45DRAFT_1067599 [Roridomyces roridus]|uniref:F-box domain-containing protein n=1 Tax=Roridomyces roridus TaxID=1738132 RepID=A0AAD7FA60_9AGAR|nr:hypothetical protein FB45DRAFT_1067599 [Roridomyces roridus]
MFAFSLSDIAKSAVARSAARDRIAELDLEIEALHSAFIQRIQERKHLSQALASYSYPVVTLPAEITSEIFTQFLPSEAERPSLVGPLSPSFLLQICRQWRDVALTTPALWSTMNLDVDDSGRQDRQLHVLDCWFQRSGHCPLSISIMSWSEQVPAAAVTPLAEAISAHASRIRDMEIRLPYERLGCFTNAMPLLHSVTVGPTQFLSASIHVSEELQLKLFADAPSLKDVVLSNFFNPFCIALPWSQFTSLTASLFCNEAAEILRQSPILEICNIDVYDPRRSLPTISSIPPLSSLHSLRLVWEGEEGSPGDVASLEQFFSTLALPALESLVVSEYFLGDDPVAAILARRPQGYPRRIEIYDAHTEDGVFTMAFPNAEVSVESA